MISYPFGFVVLSSPCGLSPPLRLFNCFTVASRSFVFVLANTVYCKVNGPGATAARQRDRHWEAGCKGSFAAELDAIGKPCCWTLRRLS